MLIDSTTGRSLVVADSQLTPPVNRAVSNCRFAANVLNDVDFARRPTDLLVVGAQQPECRPHALPVRNLDSRFEAAVSLIKLARGDQPRGSVVAFHAIGAGIAFLAPNDFQLTVPDARVPQT